MAGYPLTSQDVRRGRTARNALSNAWVDVSNILGVMENYPKIGREMIPDLIEARRLIDKARDLLTRHFPLDKEG